LIFKDHAGKFGAVQHRHKTLEAQVRLSRVPE